MERKTLFMYGAILVLGLGVMIGVVLFLRARNAPSSEPALGGIGSSAQAGPDLRGVRPFVPLDKAPHVGAYQPGQPVPASATSNGGMPYGGYLTH
jgi:hypothetical protein